MRWGLLSGRRPDPKLISGVGSAFTLRCLTDEDMARLPTLRDVRWRVRWAASARPPAGCWMPWSRSCAPARRVATCRPSSALGLRCSARSGAGTRLAWDVMLQALAAGSGDADLLQMIGSTSMRAHHGAGGGRRRPQSPGSWPFARWPCEQAPPPRPGARSAHRPAPERRPKGRLPERRDTDGGARQRPRPHARRHALRQRSAQAAPARPPHRPGGPHQGQLRVQHSVSRAFSGCAAASRASSPPERQPTGRDAIRPDHQQRPRLSHPGLHQTVE